MEITDEMLFEYAAKARDIWLSTLPADEDIPEIPTSKAFEKKMQKLIKEQRRTPGTNKFLRYMKQTVAAVLVAALVSFCGLMTVEACRIKVIEVIVYVFNELTDYRFSSEGATTDEIMLPEIIFGFVPEGMSECENRITASNRRYILYEDANEGFFELTQQPIHSGGAYEMILDTEDAIYETIHINENEAYTKEKPDNNDIIWTSGNIVYHLYGNIDMGKMKEIAEKIIISEN